jgi:RNA polymerase sigma-70 factor (ECF subfamily)
MTADGFASGIYAEHAPAVMRLALSLSGGDRCLAEDITQETMLRAWRGRDSLDGRPPRAWLCHAARNVAIDLHRRRETRERAAAAVLPAPAADEAASTDDRLAVTAALASLTPRQRAVIIELYYRDRSVAETADALGIPAGTVKSRAFHAMAALRETLGDTA